MPFWKKETPEELERKALAARQEADREASLLSLREGSIPVAASRRLNQLAALNGKFFSSTLSPAEYLLARQSGLQPLSQVVGTVFMHVRYEEGDGLHSNFSGDLTYLTVTKTNAQALAVDRMRQEAKVLGAHGIIGVTLQSSRYSWSEDFAQFTVRGTAVRLPDSEMLRQAKNLPFTSTLSGQEFWQLYESGYWPCGLVIGNAIYVAANPWSNLETIAAMNGQSFGYNRNVELLTISNGIRFATQTAMNSLKREIEVVGGDGAVDMDVDYTLERVHGADDSAIIDLTAVGTAVAYRLDGQAKPLGNRLLIMDLARKTNESIKVPTANE